MGKRGNGEGSISRRKDWLYMARYMVQTATGAKRKALYGRVPLLLPETVAALVAAL